MKTIYAVIQAWLIIFELKQRRLGISTGSGRFALLGNACAQIGSRDQLSVNTKTV